MDRVEEIMAACFERPPQEWTDAIGRACESHPELAGEIRARYGTLEAMGLPPRPAVEAFPDELGDFDLHERLGGGGMGVVYRASERSLGREVALKLIRPEILYFERARERFQREVEAAARLQHPAIISIYSVGEELGIPYFAMELLRGRTIAEALRQVAERSPASLTGRDLFLALGGSPDDGTPEAFRSTWAEACVSCVIQVAQALAHAHGRSVLHRDIKPSNVMLLPDGRAILLDFGLASSAEVDPSQRVTRTGSAVGTLYYMSPEQIVGKATPDGRTDVYSLGVTLYEMLTLHVPFAGETPLEIQTRILEGDVVPIQAWNRRVPIDVATVCRTAMRRYASERYSSAAAFADDLLRARQRMPIRARPPGAVLRAVRWMQRNRAATVAAAALFTFAVGLPLGLLVQQRVHAAELLRSFDKEKQAHADTVEALAREQQALAEAEEVLGFTVSMLLELSPEQAATDDSAKGLVDRGVARVPEMLAHHPRARAKLQAMFGRVLFFWNAFEDAIAPLEAAIRTWREYEDEFARHSLLEAIEALGISLANLERFQQADELLAEAVGLAEEVFGPEREDDEVALATAYVLQAESLQMQNRLGEALPPARRGLALKRSGGAPPESLATTVGLVSTILQQLGRGDEATEEMEALYATLSQDPHDSLPWSNFLDSFAFLRMNQQRFDEAGELYRESIAVASRLLGAESATVADTLSHYGRLLSWKGEHEAALETYARAEEISAMHGAPFRTDALFSRLRRAQELVFLERWDEGHELFAMLEPELRDAFGNQNRLTAFGLEGLGRCRLEAEDIEGAEECLREAYDILERVVAEPEARVAVRNGLVRVYRARGDDEQARRYLKEALDLAPWVVRRESLREALELGIALHRDQGRHAEAERLEALAKIEKSE